MPLNMPVGEIVQGYTGRLEGGLLDRIKGILQKPGGLLIRSTKDVQ